MIKVNSHLDFFRNIFSNATAFGFLSNRAQTYYFPEMCFIFPYRQPY